MLQHERLLFQCTRLLFNGSSSLLREHQTLLRDRGRRVGGVWTEFRGVRVAILTTPSPAEPGTQRIPHPLDSATFLRGAHHPHCERHRDHLIWIFRRPLCLGCLCVAIGALPGIAVGLLFIRHPPGLLPWVAIHLLGILPSAIQPLYQRKWYKCVARIPLGATSASYLVSGLAGAPHWKPAWQLKILVVCAFAVNFNALRTLHTRRFVSPCSSCPLGVYPTCEWNMSRSARLTV